MKDVSNSLFFSSASIWEMAIKMQLGKLQISVSIEDLLHHLVHDLGYQEVPITARHAVHAAQLPMHHKDPFDRVLIAQSVLLSYPLMSVDGVFEQYKVTLLH